LLLIQLPVVGRRRGGAEADEGDVGTIRVFVEKLDDMIRIYGHTTEICFDDKQIYLIAG